MRGGRYLTPLAVASAALLLMPVSALGKTTDSGIPRKVRAVLLKDAQREAEIRFFEHRPNDHLHDIQVVLTTEARARELDEGRNGNLRRTQDKLYLIAMRGTFEPFCLDGPCGPLTAPGERKTYPVFVLWIRPGSPPTTSPETGDVFTSYPNLAELGVPVCLRACPIVSK